MKNSELYKHWGTFHKGLDSATMQISFANHLEYSLSKDQYTATSRDLYHALALTVRDRLIDLKISFEEVVEFYREAGRRGALGAAARNTAAGKGTGR